MEIPIKFIAFFIIVMSITYTISGLIYIADARSENFDYVVAIQTQTEHDENVVLTQEEYVEALMQYWNTGGGQFSYREILTREQAIEDYEYYKADMERIANLGGAGTWISKIQGILAIAFGTILFLFDVMTFNVPHMPNVVRLGLNSIFLPMLALFLLGIYPYIKDFVFAITRMVADFIDAIVPG